MEFDIYCDETLPDLFTSRQPHARYLMIGGLWISTKRRQEAKDKITELRKRHAVWGEMKWTKISPSKQVFYEDLIDLFMSFDTELLKQKEVCLLYNYAILKKQKPSVHGSFLKHLTKK